jgi:hypothetical protein
MVQEIGADFGISSSSLQQFGHKCFLQEKMEVSQQQLSEEAPKVYTLQNIYVKHSSIIGGLVNTYEYKHTRMFYKRSSSQDEFDRQIMHLLDDMGKEGWELKSTFHEGLLQEGLLESHIHLVFSRAIHQ